MRKWKVLLLALLLGIQTLANAGLIEGIAAFNAKDYATALREYLPLANQGNAQAQTNLGFMYANGQGVPKDVVLAYMLWNIAAGSGDEKAINNRASLEGTLSPSQITEAQALASAWKQGTAFPTTSRTGKLANPYR